MSMNVLRTAEEAIKILQGMIDSGKDDGNLAVVIAHDECPVKIVQTEKAELTRPEGMEIEDRDAEDLLDVFIRNIEMCLKGELEGIDGYQFSRPSAQEVCIRIKVGLICDYYERAWRDPEAVRAFSEEFPNIVRLYKAVGWEVELEADEGNEDEEDDIRNSFVVFRCKALPSPYRKLLEGEKSDVAEHAELTSPRDIEA